jgi:hypothetical protein
MFITCHRPTKSSIDSRSVSSRSTRSRAALFRKMQPGFNMSGVDRADKLTSREGDRQTDVHLEMDPYENLVAQLITRPQLYFLHDRMTKSQHFFSNQPPHYYLQGGPDDCYITCLLIVFSASLALNVPNPFLSTVQCFRELYVLRYRTHIQTFTAMHFGFLYPFPKNPVHLHRVKIQLQCDIRPPGYINCIHHFLALR